MNQEISTRWFAIVTNLGVLIGLISVIFQMQEDRNLLRVTLTNDFYSSYINADTMFAGENLPAVYEKALLDPKNLSIGEMRLMEAQTFAPINRWINLYRLSESGIVDDTFWKTQVDLDRTKRRRVIRSHGNAGFENQKSSQDFKRADFHGDTHWR